MRVRSAWISFGGQLAETVEHQASAAEHQAGPLQHAIGQPGYVFLERIEGAAGVRDQLFAQQVDVRRIQRFGHERRVVGRRGQSQVHLRRSSAQQRSGVEISADVLARERRLVCLRSTAAGWPVRPG